MPRHTIRKRGPWLILPALVLGVVVLASTPSAGGQDTPPPPPQQGQEPQVLTRGPIHEGFAEPVAFNPKPGLVAPKEPPKAVEEIPPDEKPSGDNVAWLSGYWSWDDDRKDYIWVSGFWRVLPPGRKWVPGYWNRIDTGFQWVSGYWGNVQQPETEYLPTPPETLEQGAPTEAPSADHIWVPGCWVYRSRYLWRPGYWVVSQPGWTWYPSHYVYTPTGYVYVDGYWDYAFARRGVIFAPVYYDPWWYGPRVYVYRPRITLDIGIVSAHFFVRPVHCHYYFGDYYAASYVSVGYTPWYSFHYTRGYYCPHYAYSRWYYRSTPGWEASLRVDFTYRRDHVYARPPRTYVAQQNIVNNITVINNNKTVINNNITKIDPKYRNQMAMGQPLDVAAKKAAASKDAPLKFEKVSPQQVNHFKQQAATVRASQMERQKMEREAMAKLPKTGSGVAGPAAPIKLASPKSAIAAKPIPPTTGGGTKPGTPGHPPATGGFGGSSAGKAPGTGGGTTGGKPPVTPGTGGGSNPPVTPGTGGSSKPPVTPRTGGGSKPPVSPGVGGSGSKPPVNPPTGGSGSKPPITPPGGSSGSKPPIGPPSSGGGSKPPIGPPSSGGSSKPPSGGFFPGSGNRGGSPPPSSGSGRGSPPPSSGNKGGSGKDKPY